jgi:hypothetical protein
VAPLCPFFPFGIVAVRFADIGAFDICPFDMELPDIWPDDIWPDDIWPPDMEPLDMDPEDIVPPEDCACDIDPLDMAPDAFGLELPDVCARLAPARAAPMIRAALVMAA